MILFLNPDAVKLEAPITNTDRNMIRWNLHEILKNKEGSAVTVYEAIDINYYSDPDEGKTRK